MLRTIVKRNGQMEAFSPEKLNKLSQWATRTMTPGEEDVDWSQIALQSIKQLYDGCTTKDIVKALVDSCVAEQKEPYLYSAGKLLTSGLYKDVYGSDIPPSLYDHLDNMIDQNLYLDFLSIYTEDEILAIDEFIDHSLDFTLTYAQVKKATSSYLIKDKLTDQIFETIQFMCIRIAMTVCQDEEDRVAKIKTVYDFLKHFHISLPTPMWVNLGTPNKVGTSCLLYSVEDNIGSLNAGDNISYMMTTAGAGIGSVLFTRAKGQEIKQGKMIHSGKIPYYRLLESNIKAALQGSRGGAATTYINVLDPEIETLIHLRNPLAIPEQKVQDIDYSFSFNNFFLQKVKANESWMLIDYYHAPDLWKAMYEKDEVNFAELYDLYENSPDIPKTMVKARDVAIRYAVESHDTGRLYEFNATNANSHTAYKDPIFSSNLCVAGDTLILAKEGNVTITDHLDKELEVWNGTEWSLVIPQKTGEGKTLFKVTVELFSETLKENKNYDIHTLNCTAEHVWYDQFGGPLDTSQLKKGTRLQDFTLPNCTKVIARISNVEQLEGIHDTYCVNEPLQHKVIFNNILTGNCSEILAPTKPFGSVMELYKNKHEGDDGWVQTCNLCAISLNKEYSDEEYANLCYWSLKIIDYVIDNSEYVMPQIGDTTKKWRTAGVSILNLAHYLAKNRMNYSTNESKQRIHELFERHEYMLLEASLKISKERGLAPWIHKTKYPEGYVPLDDYNKNVDSIMDFKYKFDWADLKARIKDNGGIAHSALSCEVPSESSSILANCTNSVYPVRNRVVIKTGANSKYFTMPPEVDKLDYQLAYDVPERDLTECYAIMQKFISQGISADFYYDKQKETSNSVKELLYGMLLRNHLGLKTKYYSNFKTQKKDNLAFLDDIEPEEDTRGCAGGSCTI